MGHTRERLCAPASRRLSTPVVCTTYSAHSAANNLMKRAIGRCQSPLKCLLQWLRRSSIFSSSGTKRLIKISQFARVYIHYAEPTSNNCCSGPSTVLFQCQSYKELVSVCKTRLNIPGYSCILLLSLNIDRGSIRHASHALYPVRTCCDVHGHRSSPTKSRTARHHAEYWSRLHLLHRP